MSSRSKRSPERASRERAARAPKAAASRPLGGALLGLAGVLAFEAPGASARADALDPSMPRVVVVGAPRGAAPSERLDAQRSGRARTRLPSPLIEAWRHRITSGIELLPVVDAEDNILVALTIPEAVKLGPDGKEVWHVRLGASPPVAPPVLTSDGTLVVLTASGQAWGIAPSGAVRFTTSLGVRGRDIDAAPLALRDGGVVIASGPTLVELDRDGAIRARGALDPRPGAPDSRITGALLAAPEGDERLAADTLFTTETGAVYSFRPPGAPRKLGSFGGFARKGAVFADARTLIAVVDNRRVVALDLLTGTTHVRGTAGPFTLLDGPVAIAPLALDGRGGLALVALQSGLLLGLDAAGNEKIRLALEKPAPLPPVGATAGAPSGSSSASGFLGVADPRPSPPLIVDPDGRVGFARVNGRVGVVNPDGSLSLAGERVCGAPVGVVPAGDKRMLLCCRDGGMWLYTE